MHHNLRVYSIYYAQNIPHKPGTDPVMCAVIDNLDSIYIPNLDEKSRYDNWKDVVNTASDKSGQVTYDFIRSSINVELSRTAQFSICLARYDLIGKKGKYRIIYSTGKSGTDFYHFETQESQCLSFNSSGRLISILSLGNEGDYTVRQNITNLSLKNIENLKRDAYSIIVKKSQAPLINLQMLYNWLNYKRFNL